MKGVSSLPPSRDSLFVFTFSHLPETPRPDQAPDGWRLKTFGFFDRLDVTEATGALAEDFAEQRGDRHQRVILAHGNAVRMRALLDRATDAKKPAYLAITLLKLGRNKAHGEYHEFVQGLLKDESDEAVYLPCLDAPDLLALRCFEAVDKPQPNQPLKALIEWVGQIRQSATFDNDVERSLTIVCCSSLAVFVKSMAAAEKDSPTKALVQITDMNGGRGILDLRKALRENGGKEGVLSPFQASVGYYDVQGITSVADAALILDSAKDLVAGLELTTSTCFLGDQTISEQTHQASQVDSPLLASLKEKALALKVMVDALAGRKCLNPIARDLANEAISKFERLHSTGLIPGSRLLIWTCRDAVACFTDECADHLARRADESKGYPTAMQDAQFHLRQRHYGEFFRAICDEIDRRVSLSLPSHTRFFPCSIEAPIKVVAALDVAGRLLAASFRCYRCRESSGLLQVFNADSDKPTQFFPYFPTVTDSRTNSPFATMVITTFSPRMVRHFYFALFTVLHEVAQCIIQETIEWPSFTALAFSQAFVERHAVITTLAGTTPGGAVAQKRLPEFMHRWACDFLAQEVLGDKWRTEPSRVGPEYFAGQDVNIGGKAPTGTAWGSEEVWRSQIRRWKVGRVGRDDDDPVKSCFKLFRDTRNCWGLNRVLNDETFKRVWAQELIGQFGHLMAQAPSRPATNAKGPHAPDRYHVSVDETIRAIDNWSRACPWEEYMELASLVPFLRLFEEDPDSSALTGVLVRLIADYCSVWRDSENPDVAFETARRFVVALAAADAYRSHLSGGMDDDAMGAEADGSTKQAFQAAALTLLTKLDALAPGRAKETCSVVWNQIANPQPPPASGTIPNEQYVAQPMIMTAMVRFLVRLMHIYHIKGDNVLEERQDALGKLNAKLRSLFVSRENGGNSHIPVEHLTELWALQYRLSEMPNANYLFELGQAIKAAGW